MNWCLLCLIRKGYNPLQKLRLFKKEVTILFFFKEKLQFFIRAKTFYFLEILRKLKSWNNGDNAETWIDAIIVGPIDGP